MASYTQVDRVFQVSTPLGPDVLMLQSFRGEGEVSEPFRFVLDLLSTREDVDPAQVLRGPMSMRVGLPGGGERIVHGLVSRFRQLGRSDDFTSYQAEIVPWLWFLTLSSDCKVFQDLTVQEIVSDIFDGLGYPDYEFRLTGSCGTREYCVQYRESHFNFVSRLLEEEGLFYFFEHAEDRHLLVISDDNSAFEPMPGQTVAHVAPDASSGPDDDVITDLRAEHAVFTGRVTLSDFDYLKPTVSLRTTTVGEEGEELYDYPGRYSLVEDGEAYAQSILDGQRAQTHEVIGASTIRALQSGYRVKIQDHYRKDLNCEYAIISVSEHGDAGDYRSGQQAARYANQFIGIPWDSPYRPPRRAKRPVISGTQTAVVVGPSGEEIHTDEHGRVKVQFHWDRLGKKDENSSCWVRVAYAWAGEGWGAIHIPRIGQEVIVEFLEGDPDRPIVTGRVYNGKQNVPYELPANKTQSGLKSRSSKGGAAANFNEIRMEDMKGSELLYIHAEKDKQVVVENDRTEEVGNDESITIGNNRTESVGSEESITIGSNRTESVGKDESISVGGNRTESVGKNESIDVGENRTLSVGKSLTLSIDQNRTMDVGKNLEESVGGQHKESVSKEFVLQAKKIQLVAQDEISIKTGKATIIMKKNGDLSINGKKITIKGSGDVVVKGSKVAQN